MSGVIKVSFWAGTSIVLIRMQCPAVCKFVSNEKTGSNIVRSRMQCPGCKVSSEVLKTEAAPSQYVRDVRSGDGVSWVSKPELASLEYVRDVRWGK